MGYQCRKCRCFYAAPRHCTSRGCDGTNCMQDTMFVLRRKVESSLPTKQFVREEVLRMVPKFLRTLVRKYGVSTVLVEFIVDYSHDLVDRTLLKILAEGDLNQ